MQTYASRENYDVGAGKSSSVVTDEPEARLPRRDLVLLPLLCLVTIVLLFAGTELTTRLLWPASEQGYCITFNPIDGPHGKPNCTMTVKIAEGLAPVVHHFNACGYRSTAPCGPKPAGITRIAVLGSSIAEGYIIPYSEMLATRMTDTLQSVWHHPVEFENLGAEACLPIYAYRHLAEALRLQPDAVVLLLNPWDVEQEVDPKLLALRNNPRPINHAPVPVPQLNPIQQLQFWAHSSRTMLVAQHFMLQNRDTFLKLYLVAGGDHTAFVRYPFPPFWKQRFADLELLLGEMSGRLHRAGIPFLVIGIPERAQVLMLQEPHLPRGVDPCAFTRELARISGRHGILYLDGLELFRRVADPETLFYVVDGHPTPTAHRILGQAAAQKLLPVLSQRSIP